MPLNIDATWSKPMTLLDGSKHKAIYHITNLDRIPEAAGAYIFARRHGRNVVPLYVGETANLRKRLEQHLNDVSVMKGIENAPSGKRLFLFCQVRTKRGQNIKKVLDILQRALIEHALSAGHQLLNIQLTKTKVNTITFKGNRTSEKLAPRNMMTR